MSAPSRHERLESEIVDALRRAPGVTPSLDLDARIRARAQAAVRPARRMQPRWLSLAAGVLVLVGSGLALRIWEQLEYAPNALDAPARRESLPAPVVAPAPTDDRSARKEGRNEAAVLSRDQEISESLSRQGEVANRGKPAGADLRAFEQPKMEAASGQAIATETTDDLLRTPSRPAAKPFPLEMDTTADTLAPTVLADSPAAAPSAPAEPRPPSVSMAAPAAPAPPLYPRIAVTGRAEQAVTKLESTDVEDSAKQSAATGALAKRDADSKPESDGARQASEAYQDRVAAIRAALESGATNRAQTLLVELKRDFPTQVLPEDLSRWEESAQ